MEITERLTPLSKSAQASVRREPPPISAETSALVWLSLRNVPPEIEHEEAIYRMTTERLRFDCAVVGIEIADGPAESGQPSAVQQ